MNSTLGWRLLVAVGAVALSASLVALMGPIYGSMIILPLAIVVAVSAADRSARRRRS